MHLNDVKENRTKTKEKNTVAIDTVVEGRERERERNALDLNVPFFLYFRNFSCVCFPINQNKQTKPKYLYFGCC